MQRQMQFPFRAGLTCCTVQVAVSVQWCACIAGRAILVSESGFADPAERQLLVLSVQGAPRGIVQRVESDCHEVGCRSPRAKGSGSDDRECLHAARRCSPPVGT